MRSLSLFLFLFLSIFPMTDIFLDFFEQGMLEIFSARSRINPWNCSRVSLGKRKREGASERERGGRCRISPLVVGYFHWKFVIGGLWYICFVVRIIGADRSSSFAIKRDSFLECPFSLLFWEKTYYIWEVEKCFYKRLRIFPFCNFNFKRIFIFRREF